MKPKHLTILFAVLAAALLPAAAHAQYSTCYEFACDSYAVYDPVGNEISGYSRTVDYWWEGWYLFAESMLGDPNGETVDDVYAGGYSEAEADVSYAPGPSGVYGVHGVHSYGLEDNIAYDGDSYYGDVWVAPPPVVSSPTGQLTWYSLDPSNPHSIEIIGTGFTDLPWISGCDGGIDQSSWTLNSSTDITGSLHVSTSLSSACTVDVWVAADLAFTIALAPAAPPPGPPTISGSQGIWYLGRASVNDNCDPNSPAPSCYYNSALLTVTPGLGGSLPTANLPASWSVTDPLTGQPPTFASSACVNQACGQVIIAATAQPPGCASVNVQVTLGGVSSAAFTVYIDWPSTASAINWQDSAMENQGPPATAGFMSNNTLLLLSACRAAMSSIAVHEEFPGTPVACGNSVGWAGPIPQQRWGSWLTGGVGNLAGMFLDQVALLCAPGACSPQAQAPGDPLAGQANSRNSQFIFVGSADTQDLGKYFTAAPNMQVFYTDHARDELGTWSCPGQ